MIARLRSPTVDVPSQAGSDPPPLPATFGLSWDPATWRSPDGCVLVGGTPRRVLRLTTAGAAALARVVDGAPDAPRSAATSRLAGRLVEYGLVHPIPPRNPGSVPGAAVTVVVPVRNRTEELDRCLAALGGAVPVVVVDDGSHDPDTVAAVGRRHGATVVRRGRAGGPGAARNDGLRRVATPLVAFLDSDCLVPSGWPAELTPWFDDPGVALVAPRVVGTGGSSSLRSPLDLGPSPRPVRPGGPVSYVPSAALVVRRSALGTGFDPALRYGEDVDLVWRLYDAGWRLRYVPESVVRHREPSRLPARLGRRYRYGSSAGPLARRHPRRLAPVALPFWPTVAVGLLAGGRTRSGVALVGIQALRFDRRLRAAGGPARLALPWAVQATVRTAAGMGRAASTLTPLVLIAALRRGGLARRAAVGLIGLSLAERRRCERPTAGFGRWALATLADDVAYGAGVWAGAVRSRTVGPLCPRPGGERPAAE